MSLKLYSQHKFLYLRILVFGLMLVSSLSLLVLPLSFIDKWDMDAIIGTGIAYLVGGFLVILSWILLRDVFYTLNQDPSKPSVEITQSGFIDHRLMIREIPWVYVEWRRYYGKGGPCIVFNILERDERYMSPQNSGLINMNVWLANKFGLPKYFLETRSLNMSFDEICAEFEKHKEPGISR